MPILDRRTFLQQCGILGMGASLPKCKNNDRFIPPRKEPGTRVAILGAGAAGMSTGYLLQQRGVKFEIFEAAPTYGGRMKRALGFTDFPIPLGAEWLHEPESELSRIVNDATVNIGTTVRAYDPMDLSGFYDGELTIDVLGAFADLKFVGATWLDFYESYIVPSIRSRMRLNTAITRVDYSREPIVLSNGAGHTSEADIVVVTVPLQVLRDGDITFTPALPSDKRDAIANANVWGGLKVFLEFSETFYPTFLEIEGRNGTSGQHAYYNASYGQNSTTHVLGLFTVGSESARYRSLSGNALRDFMLTELDEIFNGTPSRTYMQHLVQDWNKEPFIRQAYLADNASSSTPTRLFEPIDNRVYFAGEAYTNHGDWGAVDDAAQAASAVVDRILV